ncbi:hypothetical protein IE077_002138 [Cardiosporidium cionae]|uniref:Uncharacterized protein n=1 Tax=Cardiosporidium cionae TaxID=476202 RepID=A0ABQ7JBG0_9APIC|nr:hypothetical protein IE077_002138 [Cardiosporidium cionae]|eukprot:KAF8821338.1 hypothetical protein IE077_002138 [Cardiosporidium cionae]
MARVPYQQRTEFHDDSLLMIPPPGFKFIPKSETICGKSGCFECFDIYCERCESKDRRIVELEMRNNDLVKYVTQLQGKLFGTRNPDEKITSGPPGKNLVSNALSRPLPLGLQEINQSANIVREPFGGIQSPLLYDPKLNLSYVATTTFSPAPHKNFPNRDQG